MRFFYLLLLLVLIGLFFIACDVITPPTAPVPDNVTYSEHMIPLFTIKCQPCHNSSVPERNWMDYNTAYNKRALIKQRIENRTMPMGISITEQERQLIIKWVDQGAKK